mgnify:CR=1 FL=1
MRTKDELFRAAQREVAARRQQAVMQAETARRAAYAAHPALTEADNAHMRARLGLAKAAALGGSIEAARAALTRADEALAAAVKEAGYEENAFTPPTAAPCVRTPACGAVSPAAAWPRQPAACAARRSTPPVRSGFASLPALRLHATVTP